MRLYISQKPIFDSSKQPNNSTYSNNISNIFDFSKEITNHYFRVCIKDDAGYDGPRGIVVVKYLVIGGKGHYNELNLLN